ncbi:penicillin-binding protein 1A [Thalassotalea aquiviva]|uniref:penicillin-binding protein 1A n=1 Tax=Thalassotalea aquiviva TaxID=3242415 RepID=UPI00352A8A70
MHIFKRLVQLVIFGCVIVTLVLAGFYFYMRPDLPSVAVLKDVKYATPMQIFSRDGKLISQFGEKRRIPIKLEDMPKQLIEAFLATEDNRFYDHFGVDPIGMSRAVIGQLMGTPKGGASTITMQTARNFFLTREQTYTRKLREIFISLHMESLLTKDEILELYLNKIELSHRAFGVGAAAQVYYGKELNELTLAEIAVIAGLPKAPTTYNPISSPERAKFRRTTVLQRMLVSGYISEEEYEQANNEPIKTKRHGVEIELNAPYVAEMAHQDVVKMFGKERAYNEGLRIYTTVQTDLQNAAKDAVIKNLYAYDERHGYRGPIYRAWLSDEDKTFLLDLKQRLLSAQDYQQLEATLSSLPTEALWPQDYPSALAEVNVYNDLVPALVIAIDEQSAILYTKDNPQLTLNWDGMKWARAYIDDSRQANPPKQAKEIILPGDVIYIRKNDINEWQLSQLPEVSGALIAISPDTGEILATVGGYSFKQSQFNRVTQANRQVGSNIKPFVYSAALDNGYTLASMVNDAPINKWDRRSGVTWRPKNSPEIYEGPLSVRKGLAKSKNVISVRLLRGVGIHKLVDHLSKFGFERSALTKTESLALGSASITPEKIVAGFSVFANGGYLVEPYIIERVENTDGEILYQANPDIACYSCEVEQEQYEKSLLTLDDIDVERVTQPVAPRVISRQNAFLVTEAMRSAIFDGGGNWSRGTGWNGTGWRARSLKRQDIAGKTGTTNESKDAWFSGFSRRVAATSWIGFDNPSRNLGRTRVNSNLGPSQTAGGEAGANAAQPAWITFMETALQQYPFEPFEQPENIISIRVDKKTGKRTNRTDSSSMFEYFIQGTEPRKWVDQQNVEEILEQQQVDEELF